jgi:membrane peptidoglycan carboxypeptidase
MKAFAKRIIQLGLFVGALGALAGAWAYRRYVVEEPGPQFTREAILAIIAQESPVFYRDGVTPMGVFFDQEHRSYVPYADLPTDWIHAIVAAEDGNFFDHPGIDPKHVARAMWQNLRAGGVVAGGSTLTQQTAKNLFYRPDRSLRSKAVEFVDALRLEEHFDKEQILEFYANQFHVSANGRGIGVAARYFFDKTPAALSTKECAFIAGMVKAPSRYNPFIGQSEERRAAARQLAEDRTAYVLRRMAEEGYLPPGKATELTAEPLAFRRGTFRYDRSVVLDEVQKRLEAPEFIELFEREGIDNPSTAGLKIVTTLDAKAQASASWGLWHHLTELGGQLERPAPEELMLPAELSVEASPNQPLEKYAFHAARIVAVADGGVDLDLGGRPCAVGAESLARVATAIGSKPAALSAALEPGRFVLASVRPDGHGCDLEYRPQLQGALLVLEGGLVRAMVGGNDNRNFNRATTAARQFGSTWKPIVYLAAIQLGWLPTDILDNRRAAFPMRGVWYYPHPDHASDPFVSMSAAGTRSENLASVWLLAHLVDRLEDRELFTLAQSLDLAPRGGEAPGDYAARMRDEAVIRSSPERFGEIAFTQARRDVLAGLSAGGHREDAVAVRSLLHGYGVAAEVARVRRTSSSSEREARLAALENNFLALETRADACLASPLSSLSWEPVSQALACGRPPAGFVPLPPEAASVDGAERVDRALSEEGMAAILVDGRIHVGTLRALRTALDQRTEGLAGREPYDPEVIALHPDWRALVGVRYVHALARSLGISAKLPDNLTLPLGAADASLVEVASAYQGMLRAERPEFLGEGYAEGAVSGLRGSFSLPASPEPTALIQEIRDVGGNVIYRLNARATPVSDPRAGELTGGILRNVVLHGTGRRAAGAVTLGDVALPLAGKTGTTNDYRNAAFVGFAPVNVSRGAAPRWADALTVAAYVGYDDNRSMRRGSLRVQGANGALPAWLAAVQGLADAGLLGPGGMAEYQPSTGISVVDTAPGTGLVGTGMAVLTLDGNPPARIFAPVGVERAAVVAAATEPEPVGPLGLPADVEFGPPEPEEGVDPTLVPLEVDPAVSPEATIPELDGGFELELPPGGAPPAPMPG